MEKMKSNIITISREFGSGGRLVGRKLAEKLGYKYYDKNLLDEIAAEKGYSREMMEEDEKRAKNSFLYSLTNAFGAAGYGPDTLSINEKFFIAQFEYITKLAKNGENCVIVGRCADYVLREFYNNTDVYIYAPHDAKVKRAVEEYGIPESEVEKTIEEVDKARENYYRYHTGRKWGQPSNYHLSINSGFIDIDCIVDMIIDFVEKRNYKEGL